MIYMISHGFMGYIYIHGYTWDVYTFIYMMGYYMVTWILHADFPQQLLFSDFHHAEVWAVGQLHRGRRGGARGAPSQRLATTGPTGKCRIPIKGPKDVSENGVCVPRII